MVIDAVSCTVWPTGRSKPETAEFLDEICDVDLDALDLELPLGFGRDFTPAQGGRPHGRFPVKSAAPLGAVALTGVCENPPSVAAAFPVGGRRARR